MNAGTTSQRQFFSALIGDGRPLLSLTGIALLLSESIFASAA
jgi:hypothetical protein